MDSAWSLKYVVPKAFMIVSSGVQTQRLIDSDGLALHEYELRTKDEITIPDKIGFVCCLFPHITEVEQKNSDKNFFACFVSK